jgi:RNA polymerase sigma-70 factor (ECF subfamily)
MADEGENLEALFPECRPRLFAWLARRIPPALRQRLDPEDVLQEAFVRALRDRHDRPTDISPRAWLYGVVRDCYLEHWERHTRGCRDHRRDEPWPDHSSLAHDLERAASLTTPSEAAARAEERRRVLEVVRSLGPEDRALLEWHWWEGFSHAETAAVLGVSEDAARQRYCRAFRRFAALWRQANPDGDTP